MSALIGHLNYRARFPPHRSRPAGYPPNRQPITVCVEERGWRGTTSSRTTTGVAPELSPPKSVYDGDTVLRTSTRGTVPMGQPMGAIEDIISQCTFLQMIYTAETPHADATPGARPRLRPPTQRPEHAHASARPASATPTPRPPAPTTTGCREDRCPVVSKRPLHSLSAEKMSPRIRIGPEPVLAVHAPSPTAAGSHCPAREDSVPH